MSMKLKRTIQEWRNLDPVNIAQRQGRPVAKHALVDAKHDILALAAKVEELAAAAVQGEPGVKWAPEEVANGNKGIRWVSDEGVHGRPTDHDCRVYLESNPNARGCHCPECTMLYTAQQPAEQQPELAKYQPCGCVICTCEHETQCQGCGGHHCGTHPVGQFSNPVYQQPAPDASGLVVTLKSIEEWVMRYADPKHPVAKVARKALADYRKQGGES